jgi:GT2 family glycosyltransferase
MEKRLSIITINYNGLDDTCELLQTLPLDDPEVEVIVVDNASRADEATAIEGRFPQVRVLRSRQNLGFAGGNNLGIRAARGRHLFFVNNDTVFGQDAGQQPGTSAAVMLQALAERLESSEKIGAVCPKIRFDWGDRPIQYAGYTQLSAVTMRNRSIGFGESDHGQYDEAHPTPYAHGAAMMVKRETIDRAGQMPECYFLYYEELDWSLMLRRAGYEIWYEPRATIYHKESRSTGQGSALRAYYITRNRLLFARRNVEPAAQRWLAYAYLMSVVAPKDAAASLLRGRTDQAAAVVRGVKDFLNVGR